MLENSEQQMEKSFFLFCFFKPNRKYCEDYKIGKVLFGWKSRKFNRDALTCGGLVPHFVVLIDCVATQCMALEGL